MLKVKASSGSVLESSGQSATLATEYLSQGGFGFADVLLGSEARVWPIYIVHFE